MSLSEPRTVVTGGASGLGRAFCVEVGRRRGRVLVSDVDLDGGEETAELVRSEGGQARVVTCDVREPQQVEALHAAASDWFGDTDLLVNNAGVAVGGLVAEVPLEDWRWVVDINLWGVIHGCHFFVPRMVQRRSGHVINVASIAGLIAPPNLGPYNVTKAGVVSLSETLHFEVAGHGVRVTVLCPTFFQTNIAESARGAQNPVQLEWARNAMRESKVQAPDVARAAIDAVERNQLYALPMADGRGLWRIKRWAPGIFARVVPSITDDGSFLNNLVFRRR
jgi:NAD(P)-dependent dehydrogenase (short-subunit alcohol dehydrogenase family)